MALFTGFSCISRMESGSRRRAKNSGRDCLPSRRKSCAANSAGSRRASRGSMPSFLTLCKSMPREKRSSAVGMIQASFRQAGQGQRWSDARRAASLRRPTHSSAPSAWIMPSKGTGAPLPRPSPYAPCNGGTCGCRNRNWRRNRPPRCEKRLTRTEKKNNNASARKRIDQGRRPTLSGKGAGGF